MKKDKKEALERDNRRSDSTHDFYKHDRELLERNLKEERENLNNQYESERYQAEDRAAYRGRNVGTEQYNQISQAHSQDMVDRNYFSHYTPEGKSPSDRAKDAGFTASVGENIAYGQPNAASAFQAWVNSPGHCEIMMSPIYTKIGIGVAEGLSPTSNNIVKYWTLDAGKPF